MFNSNNNSFQAPDIQLIPGLSDASRGAGASQKERYIQVS